MPKNKKKKNGWFMDVCAALVVRGYSLEANSRCFSIALTTQSTAGAMTIEAYFLVQGGKEKRSTFKIGW